MAVGPFVVAFGPFVVASKPFVVAAGPFVMAVGPFVVAFGPLYWQSDRQELLSEGKRQQCTIWNHLLFHVIKKIIWSLIM